MRKAHTYSGICADLAKRFDEAAFGGRDVTITGIIFANPESSFAKAELIPHIDYWHFHSDNVTDFFCAGFGAFGANVPLGEGNPPDKKPIGSLLVEGIRHDEWWYSASAFNGLVNEITSLTNWEYKGGTEILITNACHDRKTKTATLDFHSSFVINLDEAKKYEAIRDVPNVLNAMFEFAKALNEDSSDPAKEFRRQLHMRDAVTLLGGLINWLPSWLTSGARQTMFRVSREVRPKA
jgi:hypothetical protein